MEEDCEEEFEEPSTVGGMEVDLNECLVVGASKFFAKRKIKPIISSTHVQRIRFATIVCQANILLWSALLRRNTIMEARLRTRKIQAVLQQKQDLQEQPYNVLVHE